MRGVPETTNGDENMIEVTSDFYLAWRFPENTEKAYALSMRAPFTTAAQPQQIVHCCSSRAPPSHALRAYLFFGSALLPGRGRRRHPQHHATKRRRSNQPDHSELYARGHLQPPPTLRYSFASPRHELHGFDASPALNTGATASSVQWQGLL